MSSNNNTVEEIPLYEKVEALFNLRVSSSGNDIGILFEGKQEHERVWMDYEVFMRLRESIEKLIQRERLLAKVEEVDEIPIINATGLGYEATVQHRMNRRFELKSQLEELNKDEDN